jgi:lysophospholipase L1-like esterase
MNLKAVLMTVFASCCLSGVSAHFAQQRFELNGRECILVQPSVPAKGCPWIWRTEYFGHEPQVDQALVEKGFHLAYIRMSNLYGAPAAIEIMEEFYRHVTGTLGLSRKPILEGFSRGGLYAFNFAAAHPDQVSALYLDAAVLDINSWPGRFKNDVENPYSKFWPECLQCYGLTAETAASARVSPVDQIDRVAAARIPVVAVVGDADEVVPVAENTAVLERRYRELGAPITVIHKPFCKHHPHSLVDPRPVVDFLVNCVAGKPADDSVLIPGTPYGYDYFALRGGLASCRAVFEKTKRGRVAFLGGSITAMTGWRNLVQADLKRRFPQTEFDFVDAGIPSIDSTLHACRFSRDVLKKGAVDLLVVEAAVNDSSNGRTPVQQIRGMEGIVRQARLTNPQCDILMLHFADPDKLAAIRQGKRPEVIVSHEKVAAHYGVPSIDLAQEVTERIAAGEFDWEKDFKDLHPAPFGHAVYARSISRLFDAAWAGSAAGQVQNYALPDPLDSQSYFAGRLVPIAMAEAGKGFLLDPCWHPADDAKTRDGFVSVPMWVAETPGASLQFRFEGTGTGLLVASGPDAGTIEYRIDGGPVKTLDLYTRWSSRLHLPWTQMLAEELSPGKHMLELKVAEHTNSESKGHAVRIVNFLQK